VHLFKYEAKLSNLKLKTWPDHLLGLPKDIALPGFTQRSLTKL